MMGIYLSAIAVLCMLALIMLMSYAINSSPGEGFFKWLYHRLMESMPRFVPSAKNIELYSFEIHDYVDKAYVRSIAYEFGYHKDNFDYMKNRYPVYAYFTSDSDGVKSVYLTVDRPSWTRTLSKKTMQRTFDAI
jgi:hypothetical protein